MVLVGPFAILGTFVVVTALRDTARVRRSIDEAHSIAVNAMSNASSAASDSERSAIRSQLAAADTRLADAEHGIRTSKPLRLLSLVPIASRQGDALLQLVVDSRTATAAGLDLLDAFAGAAAELRFNEGKVDLAAVGRLENKVRSTAERLQAIVRPGAGLWGTLGNARRFVNGKAVEISRRLRTSADALQVMRTFLGAGEPRRYLVAIQNNAEMRDSGIVLSYAIASFVNGRMVVERHGSVEDLALTQPAPIAIPRGTDLAWGDEAPTLMWQGVTATADFPWSAKAMQAMLLQANGTKVDGVIALDVPALAAGLRAVGPVRVDSIGETITADSLASVVLDQLYRRAGNTGQRFRHQQLSDAATDIFARVSAGGTDTVALARYLGDAAAGGHVQLWSSREDEERVFEQAGLGGGPARGNPARTFHVAVENATATKLDYWVQTKVRYDVTVTQLGTAIVRTHVTVANGAPLQGPTIYQIGPDGLTQSRAGEYRARVAQWAPPQSVQPGAVPEAGLGLQQKGLTVEPGETRTVDFQDVIPDAVQNGQLVLRLVPQPRLVAPDLEVAIHAADWRVSGVKTMAQAWARTVTLTWDLRHK